MSTSLAESTWPACHSAFVFDRLAHGELDELQAAPLRAHLESCAKCKPLFAELQREAQAPLPPLREMIGTATNPAQTSGLPGIDAAATGEAAGEKKSRPGLKLVTADSPPAQAIPTSPQANPTSQQATPTSLQATPISQQAAPAASRSRRWAGLFSASVGLAAAAALLLIGKPDSGERSKGAGGFSLGMYVQHGADVRRAGPGEEVHPGDAVRFAVSSRESGYAAVLSLDPAHHASIYFPMEARAAAVPAGADVALPLSTRLDNSVGEEKLLGLFCSAPIELEPVRLGLERGTIPLPDGCQVSRWSFVKH